MLKWTVLGRKDQQEQKFSTPRNKEKRRRSTTSRHKRNSLNTLEVDKENQFTSTPIKSNENFLGLEPLKDVSNLTPSDENRRILSVRKCKSERKYKSPSPGVHKKKKDCLNKHQTPEFTSDSHCSNYFKPFEAVDSHIESILAVDLCSCKKSTKKRTSSTFVEETPPQKRLKTDLFPDISFITPPEALPGLRLPSTSKMSKITMTPLVRKFLDLKFSKLKEPGHNNSSFINDMSIDKIVDAILDNSEESKDASMIVNVDNDLNETREENLINFETEKKNNDIFSDKSSDSGFRSNNTENCHQLGTDFKCQCNNNIPLDKTIIPINETFNERCVDEENNSRKRNSSSTIDYSSSKRINLDDDTTNFTLKRQKCIRRRKLEDEHKNTLFKIDDAKTISPFWSSKKMYEDSFESNSLSCYLENKTIINESNKNIRRCLFESSKNNESSSFSESNSALKGMSFDDVRGSIDLKIFVENNNIFVHVIKCRDLYRQNGDKINAYVKVAICDRIGPKIKPNILQRTQVQGDSKNPAFNKTLSFSCEGSDKVAHLEVWHRDRLNRTSEFLGCVSFEVKDAVEKPITALGRPLGPHPACRAITNMAEAAPGAEEAEPLTPGGVPAALVGERQRLADENLFLRYLELDPTEGPDAIPAAKQRSATGNKTGRTPFTHTKRLIRPQKSGFGFSVVWTHPPRVERVEKGLPADKAGILPGDYIIFVDKHNVVMMPEIDILNLIRSYGNQLTLEIFRRNPSRNGSVPNVRRLTSASTSTGLKTDSNVNLSTSTNPQRRPSTVCSTNATSVDYGRRKLNLPQVTFSSEKSSTNPDENRRKAMYQLISKEQQYATALQYAIARFVSALAERRDLISPTEHRILFQNIEEILRITEDILDHLVQEDGEPQIQLIPRTYRVKLHEITSTYKKYCSGIKRADCVLANKMKNCNSEFVRFVQMPSVPRRRPDLTTFIHKPLEHYRETLKLLIAIQSNTKTNHEDFTVINQVVHELQVTYREITSEGGLMEPVGEGRPLLSLQDLENRLVFTKCKPFVLTKAGRQWIFGGDLTRVEGRNVRQYWTLLFSDLLLFAKVSRDRVLFITEDPLPLTHIQDMFFNVRKKDTEFRITINPNASKQALSPTVHCGPDLTRTPRKNANRKTVVLRAPTPELKAVWQNLLQRQIFQLNTYGEGSSLSSPLESPEVPFTSSVATLHSVESTKQQNQTNTQKIDVQKELDALIEHKCKQLQKNNYNHKGNAIHLEQWMKGELDGENIESPELEEPGEEWTEEMLRKRSEELQLIDSEGNILTTKDSTRSESRCEDLVLSENDQSPSKSTTETESQVTVRSSPLIPETVPVCRQCHKNCLSNGSGKNYNPCVSSPDKKETDDSDDWQPLLLLGLCANPAASLVKIDPFSVPVSVPNISVLPATPESSTKTTNSNRNDDSYCKCQNSNEIKSNNNDSSLFKLELTNQDVSPDDSPQTEEHPYHSLSSSALTLRRFGTVSSLERYGSEDKEELEDIRQNNCSSESDSDNEDLGIDNQGFNHCSVISWTAKAGSFVAEKMAFFERFSEDYRSTGSFCERYIRPSENHINGDDLQEEETSGATSGEEIWGTPTSGGEIEDCLNYEGKLSPNSCSASSDYGDDTEIMMDELLMTPPITAAAMRGLLPRRTLEPLIEEECSETTSTSTEDSPSLSPEQGKEIGSAADTCSLDAADGPSTEEGTPPPSTPPHTLKEVFPSERPSRSSPSPPRGVPRSESYKLGVEGAELTREGEEPTPRTPPSSPVAVLSFSRFRPVGGVVGGVERVRRTGATARIFEFFNVRRAERRVYETYPEGRHLVKVFSKEEDEECSKGSSTKVLKDKQMDRRFWKQLSRRRGVKLNTAA